MAAAHLPAADAGVEERLFWAPRPVSFHPHELSMNI